MTQECDNLNEADVCSFKKFDTSFHWAYGADVPVTFYYFDTLHYGHDPGPWYA